MKKLFPIFLTILVLISSLLTSCSVEDEEEIILEFADTTIDFDYSKYAGTELKVYNWGYYISDGSFGSVDVNEEFEKLTGIKVIYDNFDSNESLYAKLSSGATDYDVIIPSDYMIGRLKGEGYLAELNFDNIPNYKYIDEKYKNTEYDPENKYSVPYNVGMVGVIYNSAIVEETPTSWSLLWDEKYDGKLLNFNNSRDGFMVAQFYKGLDINSENTDDWDIAFEELKKQKNVLQSYVMDEVFNKMESGDAVAAPYYAGDFFTMYGNNDALDFYYPEEGTNIFIDAACVLKSGKNKEAAELYINFLLDPEIAKANAEYMYYASPNTAVLEDEEYLEFLDELHPRAYEILYESSEKIPTDSYIDLSDKMKSYMVDKWAELGATITEDNSNDIIYIICIILLVVIAVWYIFLSIRKSIRAKNYN